MLYNFLFPLADDINVFNLFQYLTFRTGGAVMTALLISFVLGGPLIRWLRSVQGDGQPIREDGPAGHPLTKKGTPTMGGLLILIALAISTLLSSSAFLAVEVRSRSACAIQACENWTVTTVTDRRRTIPCSAPDIPCLVEKSSLFWNRLVC